MPMRLVSLVCRMLRSFCSARAGNVAVTFALASIPIVGAVGAAVDYSRANSLKSAVQSALDSTALTLGRQYSGLSGSQLQTQASQIFAAVFKRPESNSVTITASNDVAGSTIQVNGSTSINTSIMGVVGIKNIQINGTSTATYATQASLRVALVLDNTGSMAQSGKMTALKTAANNMLAKLKSASSTNGAVYVSIIPFANDVNVGTSYASANWIDWDGWENANGSWQTTYSCNSYSRRGYNRCGYNQVWVPASHSTWNGCITDRDQNYDTLVTPPNPADADLPTSSASTLFPADQNSSCPTAMLPQSYDWTTMTSLINAMTPGGTTNQAIGLAWGWLSLTQGSILNPPAKSANTTYADHIILLTDGLNTQDRWYTNQASIDARQKITCNNIKAAGITLWTIQVNTGGDPTSTLLQQCATDSTKFYLLTSANQIISTFDEISFKITKLHLSK